MTAMKRLVREAHRRSLWQVMILYMATSWAVLEAADHVIGRFGMPDWAYGTAVLLLLIGFPIVMATAIVQEGVGGDEAREVDGDEAVVGSGAGSHTRPTAATGGADATSAAASSPAPASDSRGPAGGSSSLKGLLTWRNALLGGVAAFGLWGVVATGLLLTSDSRATSAVSSEGGDLDVLKAIAVLPFDNLSAEADNAYFADGIHEDVLTQLSKIGDLTVISRTSVLPYRETKKSLREIADELGVGSILEGSVRRAGDNVRITAQLIDASNDQHLWADNFDRGLTAANVFAIQTEIARQIAEALRATLSIEEETRIAHVPTNDLSAYDLYIRGREVYQRYLPDDNEEAIRLFKEAIASDPEYAEAWAGLADGYNQRVQLFGYPLEWADSAEVHARRAIELNPDASTGHKALALSLSSRHRVRESLAANLEAIARDPNHFAAVNNAGVDYSALGQYDEAVLWYRRSARLNPNAFGLANLVSMYARLGDAQTARRRYAEEVDIPAFADPTRAVYGVLNELYLGNAEAALRAADAASHLHDRAVILLYDAAASTMARDFERARSSSGRALDLSPGASLRALHDLRTYYGFAITQTGDDAEGRSILEERIVDIEAQLAAGADRPAFIWELAAIHAALGRTEEAIEWAVRAREAGAQPGGTGYYTIDPLIDSIRDDPRIVAIFEESGREIEAQRRRVEAEEIEAGLR